MGIIETQATRNAIYSYLGAVLGAISVFWMSYLFNPAENGVIAILISYSLLFAQFANLGFTAVTIRFFPYFKDNEKGHNGFLLYAILVSFIGFLICWGIFSLIKPYLIDSNQEKSKLFVNYIFYLMPLTFFTVFFNIFDSYLRAVYSSVVGAITKEVIQRISIFIILFIYFLKYIDFSQFLFLYIIATCLPSLMLAYYIIKKKEWKIKPVKGFINKELRREMIQLSLFSILAGGAGAIILNIDNIMVNQLLGESQSGIYRIAFYFGTIILIPARSIYRITSSIISEYFKNNQLSSIAKLYNQTCNTQFTIGLLLFIGIWVNIDNIMELLPPAFASGKNVILILNAGYVIEMGTGINQIIILNSKYYKYDTYLVILLVGITILTNYLLIPSYGIMGSAMATSLTVLFANIFRFTLVYRKFSMWPYDLNTLKLIFIAAISFLPAFLIPSLQDHLYIDIIVRSSIVVLLFFSLILKMEAAPEINQKIRKKLLLFRIK